MERWIQSHLLYFPVQSFPLMITGQFQQEDPTGLQTLELFADAPAFNNWLYQSIAPLIKGTVMEIGSGIGNISEFLLKHHEKVILSDLRPEFCTSLQQRFTNSPQLLGVHQADLSLTDFAETYPYLLHKFDTVIALNVIEHIQDDALVIRNCKSLLKEQGVLIVLVPAYSSLYNSFDKELGHYRRYNKKSITTLLVNQDLKAINTKYFNFAGIFGWWFTGSVLKRRHIPKGQLKLFNKLVPLFRIMDKLVLHKKGLSVIAAAQTRS